MGSSVTKYLEESIRTAHPTVPPVEQALFQENRERLEIFH